MSSDFFWGIKQRSAFLHATFTNLHRCLKKKWTMFIYLILDAKWFCWWCSPSVLHCIWHFFPWCLLDIYLCFLFWHIFLSFRSFLYFPTAFRRCVSDRCFSSSLFVIFTDYWFHLCSVQCCFNSVILYGWATNIDFFSLFLYLYICYQLFVDCFLSPIS